MQFIRSINSLISHLQKHKSHAFIAPYMSSVISLERRKIFLIKHLVPLGIRLCHE